MRRNYQEGDYRHHVNINETATGVERKREHIAALGQLVGLYADTEASTVAWQGALSMMAYHLERLGIVGQFKLTHPALPELIIPKDLKGPDRDQLSLGSKGSEYYASREELACFFTKNISLRELPGIVRRQFNDLIVDVSNCLVLQRLYWLVKQLETIDVKAQRRHVREMCAATASKDGTLRHPVAVCVNVGNLARLLYPHLLDEELEQILYGSLLHDIGKLAVPQVILKKDGKPDEIEWKVLREHPQIGWQICKNTRLPEITTQIIRHHHEDPNGRGYPDGLKDGAIPKGALLVRVADVADAMLASSVERPYIKEQRSAELVMKVALVDMAAKGILDRAVVNAALELYQRGEWILPQSSYISQGEYRKNELLGKIIPSRVVDSLSTSGVE